VVGVQSGVPILIPVEKLCVFPVALGEIFFAEALDHLRVVQISLGDKAGWRLDAILVFPVDGDLGLIG